MKRDIQVAYQSDTPKTPLSFGQMVGFLVWIYAGMLGFNLAFSLPSDLLQNAQSYFGQFGVVAWVLVNVYLAILLHAKSSTNKLIKDGGLSLVALVLVLTAGYLFGLEYSKLGEYTTAVLLEITYNRIFAAKVLYVLGLIGIFVYVTGAYKIFSAWMCAFANRCDLWDSTVGKLRALVVKKQPILSLPKVKAPSANEKPQQPYIDLPEVDAEPALSPSTPTTNKNHPMWAILESLKIAVGVQDITPLQSYRIQRLLITPSDAASMDVAKILTAANKQIARKLAVPSVSVYENIIYQNQGYIGIDYPLPQAEVQTTKLADILKSEQFNAFIGLPVIVGHSIDGDVIIKDIRDLQHILVNGKTRSGKSTVLHNFLISLMMKGSPIASEDRDIVPVNIIMIDPAKRLATHYKPLVGKQHYVRGFDYAENPETVHTMLAWVKGEIQKRDSYLERSKSSTLAQLNRKLAPKKRLPVLVVVFDEFEGFMEDIIKAGKNKAIEKTMPDDIRAFISSIFRTGNAVGVHCILGTQYGKRDIVGSSNIENINTKIGLLASPVASRTIFDDSKATPCHNLTGNGDAYIQSGAIDTQRFQAPWADDNTLEKLISALDKRAQIFISNA